MILFIFGATRSGKTHLCRTFGNSYLSNVKTFDDLDFKRLIDQWVPIRVAATEGLAVCCFAANVHLQNDHQLRDQLRLYGERFNISILEMKDLMDTLS